MLLTNLIDFQSLDNILIFTGLGFLGLVLIGLIISFAVTMTNNRKYAKDLSEASNSLRVFIVDVNNDRVRYFNRSRLERKKTTTITEFYNQFPANERDKIITWIGNLLDNVKDTPRFLEINVLFNHNKKSFFSILQVTKVDYEKGVIYLESYILKYMFANREKNAQVRKFVSREKFANIISSDVQPKGVTFAINFFNKRTLENGIQHLVLAQIKNALVPYITPYRIMLEHGDNQIIICDLKISQRTGILTFVNTMKNEINRLLLINSKQDQIGYSFGIAENKHFNNQVDELLENVIELANVAKEDNKDFFIYDQARKLDPDSDVAHYRTEVERIIQNKKIRYLYRPIYNVEKSRMVGYQAFFQPLDSFFDSMEELKSYAIRTEDDKELFATMARNSISRFIQEKDGASLRLFFPLGINELDYVNRTFAHISQIKEANIVLILDEDELLNLPSDNLEAIVRSIQTFKSKGYEVSLLLNDNEAALSSRMYEYFDYFLLSVASHITNKKLQNRQLPSFQNLIEKLLRYHKPIIATNIPSWALVEYVIKLGVEIVSSEAISPSDENVLPLNKKTILKLKNMN